MNYFYVILIFAGSLSAIVGIFAFIGVMFLDDLYPVPKSKLESESSPKRAEHQNE